MPGAPTPAQMASYSELQHALRMAISNPEFDASLPPLSDATWMKLLAPTTQAAQENDRLEFMGDALMYATIGRQLYAQYPDGNPNFYTCIRSALHSNVTFAMLAEKLDIMGVNEDVLRALTRRTFGEGTSAPMKTKPQVKATADLFEAVIGAYYIEEGFEALYTWVKNLYEPLVKIAADAYRERSMRMSGGGPPFRGPRMFDASRHPMASTIHNRRERLLLSPVMQRKRAVEKIKAAHTVRRGTAVKRSIVGQHSSLPAQAKLLPAIAPPKASSSQPVIQARPVAKKAPPIFIDLTISESEGEQETRIDRPLRHPLVTPRIRRLTPAVSRRVTPVAKAKAKAAPAPVAHAGTSWHSESEDESMLETMLTADNSGSDMDCDSDGVETPVRPSKLASFLARSRMYSGGLDLSPRQTGPPMLPRKSAFLK
ncbi:hypothetical protein C2E23DRAFT_802586 [Lenzites betulinus]|nr:hypothetical protein C2E23DRAFT_802586 [Lenzites betulinus]